MTEWRPIKGYEGRYEISDDGQVKVLAAPGRGRVNADRILKIGKTPAGYWQVLLYDGTGGKPNARRIHHLVLEAFIAPRPAGAHGRHLDDDRNNNHVSNLAWGTKSDNSHDMVRNGRHNHARKTHCKYGHPLNGENLLVTARQRSCRACSRRRNAEYRARHRALVYEADTLTQEAA